MLDPATIINEGDEATIRVKVNRVFPGGGAMSVTPMILDDQGKFYVQHRATFFLINRAEIATYEPMVAA